MTDQRPSPPRTSLYAQFFKAGLGNPSRFEVAAEQSERTKLLSLLDDIQAAMERTSLELPTRKLLEGHFTEIINARIKATYSADDVFQLFLDAVRSANAEQLIAEDDWEPDLADDLEDAEMEQNFAPCLPASKGSQ